MTTSLASPLASSSQQSSGSGNEVTKTTDRLANQDVFMKLLVAQLQNQNPLNPADGVQFMTQLTQFSELEQMMGVRKELEAIRASLASSSTNQTTTDQSGETSSATAA